MNFGDWTWYLLLIKCSCNTPGSDKIRSDLDTHVEGLRYPTSVGHLLHLLRAKTIAVVWTRNKSLRGVET
ncbi:uncharacterized protein ACLA_051890 [Aspergillus clavatus NRRL 1]|uniref:Uncharacterized protein n=1 Tax=Aspergillus clavatus (strain ATCC 1007 / CBS 513.65 / DSM 816 / NCTC 3887 / NRRL 1 / QM 1276 / 107) TaxID=344612 RepID=A1CIL2_ASPCL|nr:uncharacterized protein ACLA_051890 [Aspergillus clavatus NRRL 1]EAW10717.1 hypothetical protein ACLA_051890 [Aspergillus clavatus NRRL 1]